MSENVDLSKGAQGFPGRLLQGVALIGGLVLVALMLLVTWAVFTRYILNDPILGDVELIEMGMPLVVMMAMPFAAWQGAHIRVDILDARLGERGRFYGDVFSRAISIFVIFLLITKTTDKAFDAWEFEDVTNMMEIPVWIPYTAITIGMALFGAVLAWQLVEQFRRGVAGYE